MDKSRGNILNGEVEEIIKGSTPERLTLNDKRPITDNHVAHVIQLTRWGHTRIEAKA